MVTEPSDFFQQTRRETSPCAIRFLLPVNRKSHLVPYDFQVAKKNWKNHWCDNRLEGKKKKKKPTDGRRRGVVALRSVAHCRRNKTPKTGSKVIQFHLFAPRLRFRSLTFFAFFVRFFWCVVCGRKPIAPQLVFDCTRSAHNIRSYTRQPTPLLCETEKPKEPLFRGGLCPCVCS